MRIAGLQKLTLLDFPEKTACTVFTAGCNLRCPFCHNAGLVLRGGDGGEVSEAEFFAFLSRRTGILDGVCITGGEPLLQHDILPFLRKIKEMGFAVKLDTNGCFPDRLKELLEAGVLDYVAMDIKNAPEKYPFSTGVENLSIEPVRESVSLLMNGNVPFEFRTTVVKGHHAQEEMESIGRWIAGVPRYFLQAYVDSGDILDAGQEGLSAEDMEKLLETAKKYVPNAALRGV